MRKFRGFIAAALVAAMCLGSFSGQHKIEAEAAENLIVNGNFDDADNLEVWNGGGHAGGATMTAEVSDTPIGDEKIMTYGKITGRTSNYQCFAFDVTDKVEKGQIYEYSFYVMLDPVDYADAPAEQRSVEISPHIKAGGSDSYSTGVAGTVQQTLEPGVWTKFVGTFTPTWNGTLELVALRFLEQGTQYGSGPGVKGTYYITGVTLTAQDKEPELIQTGIVNLKNTVNKKLGADGNFIVGTSIVNSDLGDVETMGLVTKHFNGLTIGNELKPDAMFGYASSNPKTETVVFNGEELVVPVLDYSRAERTLDYIYKWNEQNPNSQIKVRGHVLVWHSQTPDWFFHEDYKTSNPLVSAETMSKRLEWYIATLAEHFTGADSKYKDMFYGWDVVNEAVSDSSGSYRTSGSKWWDVYQSNEFIIQAFRFANKYMPESVDLYYNDYNEWNEKKVQGIVQLLKDVKAAEGTRIDGMGMQGHMTAIAGPTSATFEKAVRAYAEVVDQVQITEWDVKVSSAFINTETGIEQEYARQAEYYHSFYVMIQNLRAEGINISGMTFWGVTDPNSWLQESSTVGGGSDGTLTHYPLLFDGGYQAKPAFWAFADQARYLKAIGATPTPAPTRAVTPTPTPEPTPEPTPAPTEAPVPTEAPAVEEPTAQEGGVNGAVIAAAVVGAAALVAVCVVIIKKKRG